MQEKQLVGEAAAKLVENNMIVGLGSGSTIFYTLKKLGELVSAGLKITGVATSRQTEELAKQFKIPILSLGEVEYLDIAIDGADEIDQSFSLIKGGGGALLREKMVANSAKRVVIIVDSSKSTNVLGTYPLPVEIVPFGWEMTTRKIEKTGCVPTLRMNEMNEPYLTDNGNYILDCNYKVISNPKELEVKLNMIPGVVENGLFVGVADEIITVKDKVVSIKIK
ncbi:ribose-5-phosphate isomerase RpiA [Priestia aryabhattai]